ncbi:MAG: CDP-diacylglycerol--glycerol-3-phosphate 3-phosphatidyltransferase [Planctomycetes bacterium]|nr:CDP-diacylglycerol--glycerol-3-phosphate 3-phosphatidyltransferase [Planctomycetota bacterium]MCK5578274.1 CDP-diacylglycerol--glycerol-3-phosphate 3-phosphatidyltransferase [Planctomycetota bacterium]
MNIANRVTVLRFLIGIIYFVLLSFYDGSVNLKGADHQETKWLLLLGLILFIIAALTDLLDGYLARKYNIVTKFGRVSDPLIDKIIVCGSFIFFVSWNNLNMFLPTWIVVVIIGREFLVSGLRGFLESEDIPFASTMWGKLKMLSQIITISCILFYLCYLSEMNWAGVVLKGLIWLTLVATVVSGLTYLWKIKSLKKIT